MYKKLFGQTAVYGLSSVLVRIFPFLIAPIVTNAFGPSASSPFVDWYSIAGVITVFLTHGMETSFFRFAQEKEIDKKTLVSTCSLSILTTGFIYLILGYVFRQDLANAFETPDQVNYLVMFLFILSFDAFSTIPSAVLRLEGKPVLYTLSKVVGAVVYYLLVFFFIEILPEYPGGILGLKYDPEIGVGYVFIANLVQSIITLTIVSKEFVNFSFRKFNFTLWKRIMNYSWPVMIAGLAGVVNQTLDRQFLKFLLPNDQAKHQIGVYGGAYKIATFITVFRQAYQLGIEPYFFSSFKDKNNHKTYALLMDVFVICNCLIFTGLMVNLQWISEKYLKNPLYFEGIEIIPFVMLGALFLGIYLNLSIWYKLSDQTRVGLYISLIGAAITILINFLFIPKFGYWASAIAALTTYGSMMVISYIWGRIQYPIHYNIKKIVLYITFSIIISMLSFYQFRENYIIGNAFLLSLIAIIGYTERFTLKKIIRKN
ncbi:Membrane protein involved in the export of O-antigen and teichoic acid [Chryseobacterium piscicola]|uniref:Membrane protein involved in the export of O-antigen and teichoic acid n=1 Tax=Chryseobacterium piscicola TaxID=551459 RepID=A0A1N7KMG3_9FLAO|nr:oligosaccharide flippase family protein [Chryseobacterium piscicola]PQA96174.1 polysaccharide biosynthesis protein [Chryseobacterium piscicola]SIS62741.1 Membrane protein involved in the export of O-antigen and teichoic acid [Chryseobacterium piscicola]